MSGSDDFEHEKNVAANNAGQFATWDEYRSGRELDWRFKPEQVAAIREVYERWKENDRLIGEALGAVVTASRPN